MQAGKNGWNLLGSYFYEFSGKAEQMNAPAAEQLFKRLKTPWRISV
jgi:hypothetical protein